MDLIRKLTKAEVPDGSLLAFFSDTHGGIADIPACKLAIEVCEAAGVTHNALVGDILDCGVASRHDNKRKKSELDFGSFDKEVDSFRWFLEWAATRPCWYVLGNHEAWMENRIALDPVWSHMMFGEAARIPHTIELLPSGSLLRLGSLVMEHGDAIFPNGGGGQNPAARLLTLYPDQTTIIGHLHHADSAWRTSIDEWGIPRLRRAEVSGHLSLVEKHRDYAGRHPNWQQRFILVRIWYHDNKPRFTILPIDILRDRKNRPMIEFEGRMYQ